MIEHRPIRANSMRRRLHAGRGAATRRAMTLFELAVVFSIGAILVTLAVISTQSLVNRTKASRVLEEHRLVAQALQNYATDHQDLPTAEQGLVLLEQRGYLSVLPTDPFRKAHTYVYLNFGSRDYPPLLVSPGPDGRLNLPRELHRFASLTSDAPAMRVGAAMQGGAPASDSTILSLTPRESRILDNYMANFAYDGVNTQGRDIITPVQ